MYNQIKQLIEEKGLRASSFADKIKVSRGTISHILSGRNSPNNDTIQKIIKCFPDISSDWLVRGEGPMYNRERNLMSHVSSSHPKPADLFDMTNIVESALEEKPTYEPPSQKSEAKKPENKVNPPIIQDINQSNYFVKKIDKIIIFFNDNTFMTFVSEK